MTAKVCYPLPGWPPDPQRPYPGHHPHPFPSSCLPITLLLGHPYFIFHTSPPTCCPVVKSSFVVPPCRGRRELVSVVDSGAGFTVTRLSAYQVTDLVPGTKY